LLYILTLEKKPVVVRDGMPLLQGAEERHGEGNVREQG
jgi:hypothetical protein